TKPEATPPPADSSVDPGNDGSQTETPLPDVPAVPGDSSDGGDSFVTQPPVEPPSVPTADDNPVANPPSDYYPPDSSTGLSGPGSLFSDYIPNAFLPVVAGITALVTAIGTLGVISVQGLNLYEIVDEIKEYFGVEEIVDLSPLPPDPELPVDVGVADLVPADPIGSHNQLLKDFTDKAREAREQAVRERNAGFEDVAAEFDRRAEQYEKIVGKMNTYNEDIQIILSQPLPDVSDSVNNVAGKLVEDQGNNLLAFSEDNWKRLSLEERQALVKKTAEIIKESIGLKGELNYAWPSDYPYQGAIDLSSDPPTLYIKTDGFHWDDPESLLNTIAHEIRHWQQHNPGTSLGGAKYDEAARLNFIRMFNADIDPALYLESFNERDARNFAEQLLNTLRKHQRR
ncbi:MAG: hypothetical protein U1E11_02900, partial [Dethiobacteria bacterium]|nr:hypothetical protein [Dethiobacteria bacterium]